MSEANVINGPPVCLVTVLYNSEPNIASFIAGLSEQDYRNWRLIAIDNASTDASVSELARVSDSRISIVRNSSNRGFARAANQGLRAAVTEGAEFMVLINSDTQIPVNFLSLFLSMRNELEADVLVPRIMLLDRPDEAWYAGGHLDYGWVFKNVHEPYDINEKRRVRTVDFASGCCLGLSKKVLSSVGLFDESFFVYWEDTDYCIRLREAQIPIYYVNDVFLMHEGGHASGGEHTVSYNKIFWRSYIQIIRKHFGIVVTLRTMVRLSLKELGRPNQQTRLLATMMLAMMKGLLTPLLPPAEMEVAAGFNSASDTK